MIEFQKRGLPHAHFLIILKANSKIFVPEDFDKILSAELLNINTNSHLYTSVVKHMMHGPCRNLNRNNVCMNKNKIYKNHYPKPYSCKTYLENNEYPKYKRRVDGQQVKFRRHYLNNQWVVPYNPYLLAKFDCHINVEIYSTVKLLNIYTNISIKVMAK